MMYQAAVALPHAMVNTSSRIQLIEDVRAKNYFYPYYQDYRGVSQSQDYQTYSFSYNTDAIPHLTAIKNYISTGGDFPVFHLRGERSARAAFRIFRSELQWRDDDASDERGGSARRGRQVHLIRQPGEYTIYLRFGGRGRTGSGDLSVRRASALGVFECGLFGVNDNCGK